MNFAVHWSDDATSALAAVWVTATDRQAITNAQARIDQLLARDPLGYGTPVSEGLYSLTIPPLKVQFEVSEADRQVSVVSVRRHP